MPTLRRSRHTRRALWGLLAAAACAFCPLHLAAFAGAWLGLRAWHPPAWAEVLAVLVTVVLVEVWWHRRHPARCDHGHALKRPPNTPKDHSSWVWFLP